MSIHDTAFDSSPAVAADAPVKLTYAPQAYPSPLSVSLRGSVQIVITNQTSADVLVQSITFSIPVGTDQDALTDLPGDILTSVSNGDWKVTPLMNEVAEVTARYLLGPSAGGGGVTLAARSSIWVLFYGFPTHDQSGTAKIIIKEETTEGIGFAHFDVTTFPWEFTFADLAVNLKHGSGVTPVAQVDNGSSVTLTWRCSQSEITAYKIYCSTSAGQSPPYTPDLPNQWTSPKLTMDTVFTVVVDPPGFSASTAVAVKDPDVRQKSLIVGDNALVAADGTGVSATGGLSLTGKLAVTDGIKMDSANGVIQRGDGSIPPGDLGLYSNDSKSVIRIVTNDAPVKFFADGGGGTSPILTVNQFPGIDLSATDAPSAIMRMSTKTYTGFSNFDNNAEISNDIEMPWGKALMLNGNSSRKPGGPRWVQVWDNLEVRGNLYSQGSDGINVQVSNDAATMLRLSTKAYTYLPDYDDNAEISNDTSATYGALMLCGNSSRKPGGPRWVQAWDNLEVMKNLYVWGEPQFRPDGGGGSWCTLTLNVIGNNGTYWLGRSGPDTVSDLRLKRDVQPVPSALDKIRRLSGVAFHWNEQGLEHFTRDIESTFSAGPNATEVENEKVWQAERERRRSQLAATYVGVVAQEVEAVLPEAVTTDSEGFKSVRYDDLIPLLIEAIKEQDQQMARLHKEIERVKSAIGMSESPV